MQLSYEQRIELLEIVKDSKRDLWQEILTIDNRFKCDDGSMRGDKEAYWLKKQSEAVPQGAFECKAYENQGKCSGCRACYSKDIQVIAYKAHGVKMAKVIKILSVKN